MGMMILVAIVALVATVAFFVMKGKKTSAPSSDESAPATGQPSAVKESKVGETPSVKGKKKKSVKRARKPSASTSEFVVLRRH